MSARHVASLALFRRVPAGFEGSFFRKRRHNRCLKIQFRIPREIQFFRQRVKNLDASAWVSGEQETEPV
jgi:hypothetical protein